MNKSKLLIIASMVMAISFQSCKTDTPPSNPYNGQVYKDDKDNTWTWNEAMGCWMIMSAMNNLNNGMNTGGYYYYYPSSNRWTNSSGVTTNPPSYIPSKTTKSINKKFSESSYKANSKSSVSSSSSKSGSSLDFTKKSSTSSSSKKSGGFGSSFKPSHS